jgi:peptidoglycan/LPS O-acetylase OafA/YrhL
MSISSLSSDTQDPSGSSLADLRQVKIEIQGMRVFRKPELHALTSARFFAALYVVFIHYISKIGGNPPAVFKEMAHIVAGTGAIPVSFFFVLSGFILSYNYVSPGFRLHVRNTEFWRARFARIYPVYLIAFLLFLPFAVIKAMFIEGRPIARVDFLLGMVFINLLMVQSWTPFAVFWNAPAWSLSVEAFFYALFPFLAPYAFRRKWTSNALLTGCIWILALIGVFLSETNRAKNLHLFFNSDYHPLIWVVTFLIGIVTAQIFLQNSTARMEGKAAAPLVVIGISLAILWVSPLGLAPYLPLAIAPLLGLVIYALSVDASSLYGFLSLRPMQLLGKASYSLYLIHVPLWNYLIPLSNHLFLEITGHHLAGPPVPVNYAAHWILFVLYLAVSILLAILSFHFLEEPMRRFVNAKTRQLSRRFQWRPLAVLISQVNV